MEREQTDLLKIKTVSNTHGDNLLERGRLWGLLALSEEVGWSYTILGTFCSLGISQQPTSSHGYSHLGAH